MRKFRWDRVQSHILGKTYLFMRKCTNISPNMRRPLVIYDFAPDPLNFLIYEENFLFFFISLHTEPDNDKLDSISDYYNGSVKSEYTEEPSCIITHTQ